MRILFRKSFSGGVILSLILIFWFSGLNCYTGNVLANEASAMFIPNPPASVVESLTLTIRCGMQGEEDDSLSVQAFYTLDDLIELESIEMNYYLFDKEHGVTAVHAWGIELPFLLKIAGIDSSKAKTICFHSKNGQVLSIPAKRLLFTYLYNFDYLPELFNPLTGEIIKLDFYSWSEVVPVIAWMDLWVPCVNSIDINDQLWERQDEMTTEHAFLLLPGQQEITEENGKMALSGITEIDVLFAESAPAEDVDMAQPLASEPTEAPVSELPEEDPETDQIDLDPDIPVTAQDEKMDTESLPEAASERVVPQATCLEAVSGSASLSAPAEQSTPRKTQSLTVSGQKNAAGIPLAPAVHVPEVPVPEQESQPFRPQESTADPSAIMETTLPAVPEGTVSLPLIPNRQPANWFLRILAPQINVQNDRNIPVSGHVPADDSFGTSFPRLCSTVFLQGFQWILYLLILLEMFYIVSRKQRSVYGMNLI